MIENRGSGMTVGSEIILGSELDQRSQEPLYQQLFNIIMRCITDGFLKAGDLLPSEMELCERFSVSRTTIRQTFAALESEGLIDRHRGRGTFVCTPKLKRGLKNLYSFSSEMKLLGLTSGAVFLEFERMSASDEIAYNLKLEFGEEVYKIARLRCANGQPLMIDTVYMPVKKYPGLARDMLGSSSLYEFLKENAGIIPKRAKEIYEAAVLEKQDAELLRTAPGSAAFLVKRISEDTSGEMFEFAVMLVRADRCRYEVELEGTDMSMHRSIDKP